MRAYLNGVWVDLDMQARAIKHDPHTGQFVAGPHEMGAGIVVHGSASHGAKATAAQHLDDAIHLAGMKLFLIKHPISALNVHPKDLMKPLINGDYKNAVQGGGHASMNLFHEYSHPQVDWNPRLHSVTSKEVHPHTTLMIHELSHHADFVASHPGNEYSGILSGNIPKNPAYAKAKKALDKLYTEDKKAGLDRHSVSGYANTDRGEWLAEAHTAYVLHGHKMAQKYPELHKAIGNWRKSLGLGNV